MCVCICTYIHICVYAYAHIYVVHLNKHNKHKQTFKIPNKIYFLFFNAKVVGKPLPLTMILFLKSFC